jgi:GNAT superfamily N-acetyltransferase
MLWRVRATLADRPGALAALAQRCGSRDVNILGLQIFPDAESVTDEVVLRAPEELDLADVAELVEDSGGRQVSVTRCTAHALTDAPTMFVRAAMRLVEDPADLPAVLDEVLDGEPHTGPLAVVHDRLELGDGALAVRRTVPFTDTERARAVALTELAELVAEQRGNPEEWAARLGPAPGPGEGSPVVRFGQVTDAPAVVRMHARCSPDVLLRRYHVPMPRLTWRSARRLLSPPGGGSLLAVAGTEVVGMVVLAPYGEGVMDVGLLVEDRWQRAGVGSGLLQQAARLAASLGATDLMCSMQADNRSLVPTVQRSGLTCRLRAAAGTVDVRIPLHDVPPMDLGAVETDQVAVPVSTEA